MDPSQIDAKGYDLNRYRREIRIKQMTPLIHFQYEDKGAYLRASGVKPQLDRFIRYWYASKLEPEWLTGPESRSLAYKLAIFPSGRVQLKQCWPSEQANLHSVGKNSRVGKSSQEIVLKEYTPVSYFANGMTEDKRVGLAYCILAKVVLESMFPELLNLIEGTLPAFFLTHNFGIRGSRGNGSFVVQGKPETSRDEDEAVRTHCLGYTKLDLPKDYKKESIEHRLVLSNYANAYMDLLRHSLPKDQRWQFGFIIPKDENGKPEKPEDVPNELSSISRLPSPILAKVTERAIYFEYLGYPSLPVSQDDESPYKKLGLDNENPTENLLSRAIAAFNDIDLDERRNDVCFMHAWGYTEGVLGHHINKLTYKEGTLNGGDHH